GQAHEGAIRLRLQLRLRPGQLDEWLEVALAPPRFGGCRRHCRAGRARGGFVAVDVRACVRPSRSLAADVVEVAAVQGRGGPRRATWQAGEDGIEGRRVG